MVALDLQYHWREIQITNSSLPLLSELSLNQSILGWSPRQHQLTKYTLVRKEIDFCTE